MEDRPEHWPVLTQEEVWRRDGSPFAVRRDQVTLPAGGEPFARMVVEHPGAVVVLAVDPEDRALVLHQYRHPVCARLVQLPAGLLDEPDEDPVEAARRELLEEGALVAEEWTRLVTLATSPGICSERVVVYLARGLSEVPDRGGFEPEHEEADMTAHWVPVADLVAGVLDQQLTDGPLAAAVLSYTLLRSRDQAEPSPAAPGTATTPDNGRV